MIKKIKKVLVYSFEKDILSLSASLAFYSMLSVVPLIIIMLNLSNILIPHDFLQEKVYNLVLRASGEKIAELFSVLLNNASSVHFGSFFSFLVLFFASNLLFLNLKKSINSLWNHNPNLSKLSFFKKYFKNIFVNISFIFLITLILVLFVISGFLVSLIGGVQSNYLPLSFLFNFSSYVFYFGFIFVLFILLYGIIPSKKIKIKHSWRGVLFSSFLFGIGQIIIGNYLEISPEIFNSSLNTFLGILLWFYYSGLVFLLGVVYIKLDNEEFN